MRCYLDVCLVTHSYRFDMCPVLSNKGKRTIYDAGLFGLIGDDEDEVGFCYEWAGP